MKARVTVTLKTGVLDPQGKAIEGALQVARLRRRRQRAPGQGVSSIELRRQPATHAQQADNHAASDAAEKLLANTGDRELSASRCR